MPTVSVSICRRRLAQVYHGDMAVDVKKLDIKIGDVVEIGGRRYDVVSDKDRGLTLEPAITKSVDALRDERGGRPVTQEEFDELFGDLPRDGDG